MQFILTTLGCKTNRYEGTALSAELIRLGMTPAASLETADIFIVNSCTLTENSDRKTRRLLAAAKRINPHIITILTGCMPQVYPEKAAVLAANITTGTSERQELPSLITQFIKSRTAINKIAPLSDIYEEFSAGSASERTRAFIKIQDGCDCNCTYCIVPAARGKPRSRPLDSVRAEALASVAAGYKEIVLTGINLAKHTDLCAVVEIAAQHAERVRLSSLEPDLLTDEMLERLSKTANLCPHFHLSLQSGSDSVLKRMGRRYTSDDYTRTIKNIRSLFGTDCTFTTDMITGFPGETEQEFSESLCFARQIGFSIIHVFPFSPRPGTTAALMTGQVPRDIMRDRRDKLLAVADELRAVFLGRQIGRTFNVLVEKDNFGYTENYAPVKIIGGKYKQNDIIKTKIINKGDKNNVSSQYLYGEKA